MEAMILIVLLEISFREAYPAVCQATSPTLAASQSARTVELIAADDLDVTCAGAMKITDPSEVSW